MRLPRTIASYGMLTSMSLALSVSARSPAATSSPRKRERPAVAGEQPRAPLAEGVIDALRVIHVDAEARRREQLDREHLGARQAALDRLRDLPLPPPLLP